MTREKVPDRCPTCDGPMLPHCPSPTCPGWRKCADCKTTADANGRSFEPPKF